jgi:hypothetical protein
MIKVRIKVKDKKYTIPVPYGFLTIIGSLLTSKLITRLVNKAIKKDGHHITFPEIKKDELKPLIKALSEYKGLVMVETKFHDGTEVWVRL